MHHNLRAWATQAFYHALKSVNPKELIKSSVRIDGGELVVSNRFPALQAMVTVPSIEKRIKMKDFKQVLVLGAGKASQEMCVGLLEVLTPYLESQELPLRSFVNYPRGQKPLVFDQTKLLEVEMLESSHPLPDMSTLSSTERQLDELYTSSEDTLMLTLMSGGGSALFECLSSPVYTEEMITLQDLTMMNQLLINCGASINEINVVRKHVSQVKGGQMAKHAYQSKKVKQVVGLYLSDVVGNDLSSVASGPTLPDPSSFVDAMSIVDRYGLLEKLPPSISDRLKAGLTKSELETPKADNVMFDHVCNILIGSADTSALSAKAFLETIRLENVDTPAFDHIDIFSNSLSGEASQFGAGLVDLIRQLHAGQKGKTAAYLATGEFTVTIKGKGRGGRNQEMLLAFLLDLERRRIANEDSLADLQFAIISCAFDGIEGNSPATGAVVSSDSIDRLINNVQNQPLKTYLVDNLLNNNSYPVLDSIGDSIVTGFTGTNVNDMTIILVANKL